VGAFLCLPYLLARDEDEKQVKMRFMMLEVKRKFYNSLDNIKYELHLVYDLLCRK